MRVLLGSLAALWDLKGPYLQFAGLLAAAAGAALYWLWLPVAALWDLVLHVLLLLVASACIYWALALLRKRFAGAPPRAGALLNSPAAWTAVALFACAGVWLPYRLVWWVPRFATLQGQAASAGARFLAAWFLFTGGLAWLAACAGRIARQEDRDGTRL